MANWLMERWSNSNGSVIIRNVKCNVYCSILKDILNVI